MKHRTSQLLGASLLIAIAANEFLRANTSAINAELLQGTGYLA